LLLSTSRYTTHFHTVTRTISLHYALPILLRHEDFSFDPRTLMIRTEAGSAHTGLCFDNRGRKYVSDLAHPLQAVMFPARYLARKDLKSTRLNSSHVAISYAVFCLKKKKSP